MVHNRYVRVVEEHLALHRPDLLENLRRTQQLETYLTEIGEEMDRQIEELETQLVQRMPKTLSYMQRVQDLTQARRQAEETVIHDLFSSLQHGRDDDNPA